MAIPLEFCEVFRILIGMRRLCATISVVLISMSLLAQEITKTYDKLWGGSLFDTFRSCAVDSTGNVYVMGLTNLTASNRATRVIKYGPTGSVVWSKDMPVPSQGNTFMSLKLIGTTLVVANDLSGDAAFYARLNPSNGNIVWQHIVAGSLETAPAISVDAVAAASSSLQNDIVLTCLELANGNQRWSVPLGKGENSSITRALPSGDFVATTFDSVTLETVVRKLSKANGNTLWERRFAGIFGGSMDMLSPSGNVVVGLGANTRVETLNGSNGDTLRVDPLPAGATQVFASLGDSYYAQTDDFSTRVQLRDHAGYLLGATATQESYDFLSAVDPSGKLVLADERNNVATGKFDLRVGRELGNFGEFFPLNDNPQLNNSVSQFGVGTGGTFIAACGQTKVSDTDTQARVTLFNQAFNVNSDVFAYRKGQVLNVGAPGFLANDAAWQGGSVTIAQPANGVVVLNADKSFRYTPNVGFFGADSFNYAVRVGIKIKTATVFLVPMTVTDLVIDPLSVTGGTSMTGTVVMSQPNPFPTLVVQLTENITGLAVTSSVAIPQGKSQATFNIISVPVATDQTGLISAKLDGVTVSKSFTVKRAVPDTLTINPSALVGGLSFSGRVGMTGKAPSVGYTVNITHSGTEISTPVSINVPAGTDFVIFAGTTGVRSTSVTHLITAASGGVSKTANLTINPGGLFAFTITPTIVKGGLSANGKIQTAGLAPAGGTVVTMTKDGGNVSVPGTVTVPEGAQFKNFTMTTSGVTSTVTRTITATFGSVVKTATLTITP